MIMGKIAGTLGMVPSIINPIYTLYSRYLLDISFLKGSNRGAKQLGAVHPKGTMLPGPTAFTKSLREAVRDSATDGQGSRQTLDVL